MAKKKVKKIKKAGQFLQFPVDKGAWCLLIESANNGFILHCAEVDAEGIPYYRKQVIEDKGDEYSNLKTAQQLLWDIMDYFSIYSSKHNKYNLKPMIVDERNIEVDDNLLK